MNKRIIGCLLTLAVMVTATGCESTSPEEIYNTAMNSFSEVEYVDMSTSTDMTMSMPSAGVDMEVTMDMEIKGDYSDKENIKFQADTKMSMMGMDIEMDTFYVDGYQYMEMMGQKMKVATPIDEYMSTINAQHHIILAEEMKEFSMEEVDDNYVFTYVANEEKLQEMVSDVMDTMGTGMTAEDMGEVDITVNSMSGSATITAEGEILAQTIDMDIDMTVEGETVGLVMTMESTINSINQPLEITIPNTDDYVEVDDSGMPV